MSFWQAVLYTSSQWWEGLGDQSMLASKLFALLVLIIDLIRRRFKFSWPNQAIRSCIANIMLVVANASFGPITIFIVAGAQAAYELLGIPHVSPAVWDNMPYWILVPLVLLASDFADYWNHRLMHSSKWFWPIHAIHHSDPHVTVLTTGRVHVFEPLVMRLSYVIILSWLGIPAGVLGGAVTLLVLHNMYVHINVDWSHGPFRHIIASPRFHRWHHADEPEAYGKNLANVFPIYDIIFGTYHVPGTCTAEVGAEGVPTNNVLHLLMWPFKEWSRMIGPKLPSLQPAKNESSSGQMPHASN